MVGRLVGVGSAVGLPFAVAVAVGEAPGAVGAEVGVGRTVGAEVGVGRTVGDDVDRVTGAVEATPTNNA